MTLRYLREVFEAFHGGLKVELLSSRSCRSTTASRKLQHCLPMDLVSRLHTGYLSWSQNTPLPSDLANAVPTFQPWQAFNTITQRWTPISPTDSSRSSQYTRSKDDSDGIDHVENSKLVIATWNIDAFSPCRESRISSLLSHILSKTPSVDIIFFQEVSRAAHKSILADSRIRESWILSDTDEGSDGWLGQPFTTLTLISTSRFLSTANTLGSVWRVDYPSRYGRDALCCDVIIEGRRMRLVNVHLDSLATQPSHRPRQLEIASSLLRSAGAGIVAGDFNPVLPEDKTLVQENGLVDAWTEVKLEEDGFTWGVDGTAPFPPNRMDKVAMLGLKPQSIEVMHPGLISRASIQDTLPDEVMFLDNKQNIDSGLWIPWSDHSGLICSFSLLVN